MKLEIDKLTTSFSTLHVQIEGFKHQLKNIMTSIDTFKNEKYNAGLWEQFLFLKRFAAHVENTYYCGLGVLFEQEIGLKVISDQDDFSVEILAEAIEILNELHCECKLAVLETQSIILQCKSRSYGYHVSGENIQNANLTLAKAKDEFARMKPLEERVTSLIHKLNVLKS